MWCHENLRVFQDRLVNDQDRDWFLDLIKSKMKSDFDLEYTDVVVKEPILYGDFLTVGVDNKPYVEMENYEKVVACIILDYSLYTIFLYKFQLIEIIIK